MIKSQKTKRMMAVLITLVIIAGIMPVDLRSNVVAEEVSETTTVKPTETQIKETTTVEETTTEAPKDIPDLVEDKKIIQGTKREYNPDKERETYPVIILNDQAEDFSKYKFSYHVKTEEEIKNVDLDNTKLKYVSEMPTIDNRVQVKKIIVKVSREGYLDRYFEVEAEITPKNIEEVNISIKKQLTYDGSEQNVVEGIKLKEDDKYKINWKLTDKSNNEVNKTDYKEIKIKAPGLYKLEVEISREGFNTLRIPYTSTTATNEKIYDICSKYKEYYYKFQKADDHLKNAKKYMKKIGDSNSGLIKKTVDAYEDWKNQSEKLDKTNSDMKEDNKRDLEEEKKLIEENLTDESLKELSNRIDNVKALIKTIYDNIDSTKYHNTQLKDIDSIEVARSKAGIRNDKISYIYSELKSYAEQTFKFSTGNREVNVKNSNHPDIVAVNEPKLHKWMRKKFKNNNSKKSEDDAKDEYKDYKKKSEDDSYEDGEIGKTSNEIKNQKNLPSKGGGNEKKEKTAQISKVTSFLTNLFSDGILDSLGNLGKSFRDDLYTTDYVMNMFSYDTFVNEGKKKYTEDTNSTISTEDFEKNKDKTFGYNKTLTNMPINEDNNFAYQGEVEYILYGNYNAINKANSYGRIFLLRYAFNIAPVFQKFWKNINVDRDSVAISSATSGVIPAALIKLAICLMYNVVETANDLMILRAGDGVPLIKKTNGVNVEYLGIIKNKKVSKNDFKPRYSEYLSLFLFLKLVSTSENDVYKRIADVVQMNMVKVTKLNNFQLKKSVVYYQIKSNISISPLLLKLEINKGENAYKLNTLCDYEYKNIAGY